MGRNKFSQKEIEIIGKLLRRKCSATRFQQKEIRHQLRVDFEFNISDFNVQGKGFGEEDLRQCIQKGIIQILDDATIESMKAKRERDRLRDLKNQESQSQTGFTDWHKALEEWEKESLNTEQRPITDTISQ